MSTMTSSRNAAEKTRMPYRFIRVMYGAFVLLSMYHLVFSRSFSDAMSCLGIALIFDPFDSSVQWAQRPLYQRGWLLLHVTAVLILLGLTFLA